MTTEFGQFLKLPILVAHFIDHTNEEDDITFWNYLVHHYGGHEMDEDWETDMKLPFMKGVETLNIPILSPESRVELSSIIDGSIILKIFPYYTAYFPNFHLNKIWQPPQFC